MRFIYTFLLISVLQTALAQLPTGFVQKQVARNLNPTTLAFSPDGRLFVAEKDGKIREVVHDILSPDPFLTLPNVDATNERGLSGLCFHPDFPRSPYFYVYYTVAGKDHNRLSRFQVANGVVDPKSETVLIELDPLSGYIHNAGALRFGADRKLYVGVGDGTNADAAQKLTSLLGKILRLNDDGSIPADNPLVNQTTGNNRAIFALGFRNPFSMDIDPKSGKILVGDVGNDRYEEVNDVQAGHNYGWPLIEGTRTTQEAPSNYSDPLYAYDHNTGCAVTGMAFYTPPTVRFPSDYLGKAFFADYCSGRIQMFNPSTGQLISSFVTDVDRPISMAASPDGYLYYIARGGLGGGTLQDNTATWNGSLYKVSYFDSGLPFISSQSSGAFVPVGESTTFSVNAVGQKPMLYTWYRNGKPIEGATQAQYTMSSPTLADNGITLSCIVSNALGKVTSETMSLRVVQAQRPIAQISQPLLNKTYRAGDVLTFSGTALTPNKQPLTGAKLTWWIDFHHDDHTHPALDPVDGLTTGSYKIPRTGETSIDVWYRIHLLATDVSGLTNETFVDVKPELATVSIKSPFSETPFYLDGEPRQTDVSFQSVVGMLRSVKTKPYLARPNGFYRFISWGNSQTANEITYEVPAGNPTLTMAFTAVSAPKGTGLRGAYYANSDEVSGSPNVVRLDTTIDFNWGEGSPAALIGQDRFVVRWTGRIQAPFTDTYTFDTETDDGVRLWINNKLLIDKWSTQPSLEWSAEAALVAGQLYNVQMDYLENEGYATARLLWSSPQFEKAVISKPYLFSPQVVTATESAIETSLVVFPVPTHEQLTVRHTVTTIGTGQLDVLDLLGRSVYSHPIHFAPGTNDYTFSVHDWPTGLYQVVIRSTDQSILQHRLLVR